MIRFLEKKGEYILSFLLTFFLNASILGLYGEGLFSVYNLLSAAIILVMFIFFGFLKKHRVIGGIIYLFALMFCMMMMFRFIYSGDWSGSGFQSWFLTAGERQPSEPRYFLALVSAFPFFLSSVVYYFSNVLYRTLFLMLGSLVPCALYVKTLSSMSTFYMVCIAGLNAALYAANAEKSYKKDDSVHSGTGAKYLAVVMLTCITLIAASVIPKSSDTKYYDIFEYYFMDAGNGQSKLSGALGQHSGNAGLFRDLDNTILFDVNGEDLLYFRKQNFDIYSQSEHCWYPLNDYSQISDSSAGELLNSRRLINCDDMLAAMKKGAELDDQLRTAVSESLLALDSVGEEASTAVIIPVRYPAEFYLTSLRTFNIRASEENILINPHMELRPAEAAVSTSYTVSYYKESGAKDRWVTNGGASFTDDEYSRYMTKLINVLEQNGETGLAVTARAFFDDFNFAVQYKSDTADNYSEIPADIAQLAAELTEGMTYDWQKASALQNYFLDEGFTYDLDYIPPAGRNTASYFVFTSKRGTCSDFATAYTLMARSVGLTVRYTEGFSPDITTEKNVFAIRSSSSHAYPEVYIQNLGWTVFEPTVSAAYNIDLTDNSDNNGGGIKIDTDILFNSVIVLCIIFGICSAVFLAVPGVKRLHEEYIIGKGGADAVLLMYRRMSSVFGKRSGIKTENLTPGELSRLLNERLSFYADEFILIYEKTIFGETAPTSDECERCRELYREFRKAVKNAQQLRK
ncbi:MAG: transglutaminase family protein [Oscillospiraceae bacterium]